MEKKDEKYFAYRKKDRTFEIFSFLLVFGYLIFFRVFKSGSLFLILIFFMMTIPMLFIKIPNDNSQKPKSKDLLKIWIMGVIIFVGSFFIFVGIWALILLIIPTNININDDLSVSVIRYFGVISLILVISLYFSYRNKLEKEIEKKILKKSEFSEFQSWTNNLSEKILGITQLKTQIFRDAAVLLTIVLVITNFFFFITIPIKFDDGVKNFKIAGLSDDTGILSVTDRREGEFLEINHQMDSYTSILLDFNVSTINSIYNASLNSIYLDCKYSNVNITYSSNYLDNPNHTAIYLKLTEELNLNIFIEVTGNVNITFYNSQHIVNVSFPITLDIKAKEPFSIKLSYILSLVEVGVIICAYFILKNKKYKQIMIAAEEYRQSVEKLE